MRVVKAQRLPRKEISSDDILAKFCYHFPQYQYHEARRLPYKRIVLMLKVAEKEQARLLYTLTRAISAPHTKKGVGVNSLLNELKEIING